MWWILLVDCKSCPRIILLIILVIPCKPAVCDVGKQIPSKTGAEHSIQMPWWYSISTAVWSHKKSASHVTASGTNARQPRGGIKPLRTGNHDYTSFALALWLWFSLPSLVTQNLKYLWRRPAFVYHQWMESDSRGHNPPLTQMHVDLELLLCPIWAAFLPHVQLSVEELWDSSLDESPFAFDCDVRT